MNLPGNRAAFNQTRLFPVARSNTKRLAGFYLYFPRIGGILRAMFRWFGVSFATHRATRYVYTRIYSNAFSISRIALTDREASLNTAIISPSLSPLSPLNHRRKIDAFIVDLVPIFTPSSPRQQEVEEKYKTTGRRGGRWALWFESLSKPFSIDLRSHKV